MRKLNVILLIVDSLRADHLGCYGYKRATSPNIDAFAEQSVVFNFAFSQATWTIPSVASILTSLYPSVHGLVGFPNPGRLNPSKVTLATLLKREGYKTVAFTGGGYVDKKFGFDQGFDLFKNSRYFLRERELGKGGRLEYIIEDFLSWWEKNCGKSENFFAYLHCWDVHEPFIAHDEYLSILDPNYKGLLRKVHSTVRFIRSSLSLTLRNPTINSLYKAINKGQIKLSEADVFHLRALYDNEILYMDKWFGVLVEKLENLGLLDSTLIILTADHGNQLMERGRIGHGGPPYDTLIRIPLIIRFPRGEFGGTRINAQVQSIDILPTILDYLGIKPSEEYFQGRSLLPLIQNRKNQQERPVYAEDIASRAVRWNNWKLISRALEVQGQADLDFVKVHETQALLVKPKAPNSGARINLRDILLPKGEEVSLMASIKALGDRVKVKVKILGTPSEAMAFVSSNWSRVATPPLRISENRDEQFNCMVISEDPFIISEFKLLGKRGECYFSHSFCDLYEPCELYDLSNDPLEQNNLLFCKENYREIFERLLKELNLWVERNNRHIARHQHNQDAELDDEIKEKLRNLGYLE